jgi:hypothetical protein
MPDQTSPRKPPRRFWLFAPYVALVVVVSAWSIGWLVLRQAVITRFEQTAARLKGQGWTVTWADRSVSGYPFRLWVRLNQPHIAEPSGWSLAAPRLEAEAYAFAPNRWVIVAPEGLGLTRPFGGGAAPSFVTSDTAVAQITVSPSASAAAAVLAANPDIASGFGASPAFYAIGELAAAHTSAGSESQTLTANLGFSANPGVATGDLMVGLYNASVIGDGFTSLTFDISAQGHDLMHDVFTTAAAATAFFTDNAIDLGSLATDLPNVSVSLTVVSDVAGGGFAGEMIFGDPPGHPAEASLQGATISEDHLSHVLAHAGDLI